MMLAELSTAEAICGTILGLGVMAFLAFGFWVLNQPTE